VSFSGKSVIVHPFVFAALPVVLLFSFAKSELLPEETLSALMALECLAALTFALALGAWRNACKAAIAASYFMVLLFTYRVWQITLEMYWSGVAEAPWIAVASFLIFIALMLTAFLKGQWNVLGKTFSIDFERLNSVLNIVSSLLLLLNVVPLIFYEIGQQHQFESERALMQKALGPIKLDQTKEKPDVYYIILDGFAAPQTLQDFWQYRDPGFGDYLKNKGFYVVPRALSNFDRTEFSLCSSLNMDYINDIRDRNKGDVSGLVFMRLIQDCSVVRLFKELGYRYVTVSSGSFGTDQILTADKVIRSNSANHFFRAVAYCTPWWSLEYYFPLLRDWYGDTRLTTGTEMAAILAEKSPKFVFIHTDLPHAPYLFDENGRRLQLPPGLIPDWQPPASYFSQWKYCVAQTEQWIDKIMAASGGKAIIIVQSDHGSGLRMKKTTDWYNERMRILNAIYLPGNNGNTGENRQNNFYATATPVNTFRIILNRYFQAQLPLLDDQSYCAPVWEKPFEWQEVTKQIHFAKESK